jgi:hypothetical protein
MKPETADYFRKARGDLDEARKIVGIGLANVAGSTKHDGQKNRQGRSTPTPLAQQFWQIRRDGLAKTNTAAEILCFFASLTLVLLNHA